MRRSSAPRSWAICVCVSLGRFGQGRSCRDADGATWSGRGKGRSVVVTGHLLDGNGEASDDMTSQGKQRAHADARAIAYRKDMGER